MLAFRFAIELATYALLAWAGASANAGLAVRIVLAIGLPTIVIVIWFRAMAPRARHRLREPASSPSWRPSSPRRLSSLASATYWQQ